MAGEQESSISRIQHDKSMTKCDSFSTNILSQEARPQRLFLAAILVGLFVWEEFSLHYIAI